MSSEAVLMTNHETSGPGVNLDCPSGNAARARFFIAACNLAVLVVLLTENLTGRATLARWTVANR